MRSLSVRIALILIASIVAVVLVATAITSFVLDSNQSDRMVEPMAHHIAVSTDLMAGGKPPPPPKPPRRREPRGEIVTVLPEGMVSAALTSSLQQALAREGETRLVEVLDTGDGDPVAALKLDATRWMLFGFPGPRGPPPDLWLALASWLTLVVIGVVAVALVMARRVTHPFVILENAIASVGPDGVLPHTPEVGSGEARETAAALNALSDRLRVAMESRMRLVAAAGHDLRTPMTRMRLRAEFLPEEERDSWLTDLDELDAIADSAIRLVREEGAGDDRRPVALDALVRDTVDELRAAGLVVELQRIEPAAITPGPLALKRALRNLITNAATHGGGARVALSVTDGQARVVIDDDGPGIADALIPQVFEPFFRADPGRGQAIKGAGLGLAIAREIVERFGGSIAIGNRPEGGLQQVLSFKLAAGWDEGSGAPPSLRLNRARAGRRRAARSGGSGA